VSWRSFTPLIGSTPSKSDFLSVHINERSSPRSFP
jgi:hypothetical protein